MASAAAARSPLEAVLPDYEVLGELGRGAMGVVLAGRHRSLERHVAIKELPPGFAADATVRDRFLREARTLASLNHPHVVQVFDFVDRGGHLALIMERLPGGTVWDRFTSRGVTAPAACGLVLSAAAGLDHAHRHGVLHRDVKPENLLFTDQGRVKVTDFGIAKMMGGERTLATADGAVLGTPAYMAPEQAEGLAVGPPADVYACGTILYEMLCGRLPFERAGTPMATLIARIRDDAPPLASVAPQVPPGIAGVVDVALARTPEGRFPTVEDFAVALGQAAAGVWGPNWLAATGLAVTGSDAIEWAARTARAGGGGTLSGLTPGGLLRGGPSPGGSVLDGASPGGSTRAGSPATEAITRASPAPATVLDDFSRVSPADLVDIARVGRRRRGPGLAAAAASVAALVLGAAAVVVALGVGPARPGAGNGTTGEALAGDGAAGQAVEGGVRAVDFSQLVNLPDLEPGGGDATLRVDVLGIPLGQVQGRVDGDGVGRFDPGYLRWTAVGRLDATIQVAGKPDQARSVVATQPWLTTGPAAAVTLAALFGLASAASHRRGLRRRPRPGLGSHVGLAMAGGVLGACAAGYAWLIVDAVASVAGVVGSAGLGAASGLALSLALRWSSP